MKVGKYIDLVGRSLQRCAHLAEKPHFARITRGIPGRVGTFIWADDRISFHSGYILTVWDRIRYDSRDEPTDHSFSYFFHQNGRLIFGFDTHKRWEAILWDDPCHVEVLDSLGREARIDYESGREWLKGVHFMYALHYACREMEGKGETQPWHGIL